MTSSHTGSLKLPIIDQDTPLAEIREAAQDAWEYALHRVGAVAVGIAATSIQHGEHPTVTVSGAAYAPGAGKLTLDTGRR